MAQPIRRSRSFLQPAAPKPAPRKVPLPPPTGLKYVDGFTCCVGAMYAEQLSRSLATWHNTLDSVTVVTRTGDEAVKGVCKGYARVRVVETDVFTAHGASFNKAAALCVAYAAMRPIDGVLHFDSDILPPRDWRRHVEKGFRRGTIAGIDRLDEAGHPIVDKGPKPYGFFQLWHADDDRAAYHWPLFETWHGHCGNYDMEFLERWPRELHAALPFTVVHFGEPRKNWFGVEGHEEPGHEKFRKMKELNDANLHQVRMAARKGVGRLAIPEPKLKLALSPSADPAWMRAVVRACMTDDPFLVSCVVGARQGYTQLTTGTYPHAVRERVLALKGATP